MTHAPAPSMIDTSSTDNTRASINADASRLVEAERSSTRQVLPVSTSRRSRLRPGATAVTTKNDNGCDSAASRYRLAPAAAWARVVAARHRYHGKEATTPRPGSATGVRRSRREGDLTQVHGAPSVLRQHQEHKQLAECGGWKRADDPRSELGDPIGEEGPPRWRFPNT